MTLDPETHSRLTILNTVLLAMNTLMVGSVIAFGGGPPPEPPPQDGAGYGADYGTDYGAAYGPDYGAPAAGGPAVVVSDRTPDQAFRGSGGDPLVGFLSATAQPVKQAAADLGRTVELPDDALTAACVAAGDLTAAPCAQAVKLLQQAYAVVGMPFPDTPDLGASSSDQIPPTSGSRTQPASQGGAVLAVYFDTVQARLRQAAQQAGDSPEDVLPSPASVAAAVATGDPQSAQSRAVMAKLRRQFARYDLRYTDPFVGASEDSSQRELLASYLDHMVLRLERAAGEQGRDAAALTPSAEALAAAVATGEVDSPATEAVLDDLRTSYQDLDVDFTEPPR